jgi:hypothetical protein
VQTLKQKSARFVGVCVALAALLTLGACVQRSSSMQPANKTARLGTLIYSPSFASEAIVVLGLRRNAEGSFSYAIAAINGEKVEGDGLKSWTGFFDTTKGGDAHQPLSERLTVAEREIDYHILRVPPGNYAVLKIGRSKDYYLVSFPRYYRLSEASRAVFSQAPAQYQRTDLVDPVSTPETPVFTARPNEVVYVGDLQVDFADAAKPTLAIGSTPEGARAALLEFGEKREMSVRQMVRPTGADARVLIETTATPASITIRQF